MGGKIPLKASKCPLEACAELSRSRTIEVFFYDIGVFICMILLVLMSFSCKDGPKHAVKTEPIVFKKEGELSILKHESNSLVSTINIEIAENDYETETGLMYRKSMGNNEGMLFIFPDVQVHSFYMKNTEFPLDIIFINGDKKIATIQKNAHPLDESSLFSKVPVQYVLEINAGLSDKWNLEEGDSIEFTRQ